MKRKIKHEEKARRTRAFVDIFTAPTFVQGPPHTTWSPKKKMKIDSCFLLRPEERRGNTRTKSGIKIKDRKNKNPFIYRDYLA